MELKEREKKDYLKNIKSLIGELKRDLHEACDPSCPCEKAMDNAQRYAKVCEIEFWLKMFEGKQ